MANMGDSPHPDAECSGPGGRGKVLAKAGLPRSTISNLFRDQRRPSRWWPRNSSAIFALDRDKVNVQRRLDRARSPHRLRQASILIGTILDELERRDLKRGLVDHVRPPAAWRRRSLSKRV